ncbi:MAG: tail fiber domain-containing protein [Bacteroidetes bacterium]|nr:tail fiber domain-containing protein [Bacteroidota bacterium]
MKKIFLFLLTIICLQVFSQAPQSMNYQAVARNAAGAIIPNQTITVRLTVHDGSAGGSAVYIESTSTATNQFGLFTVKIGTGSPLVGTFAGINWGSGDKFLQIELDAAGGSNYSDMGTVQLLSVPYALYAANSAAGPVGATGPTGAGGPTGPTGSSNVSGTLNYVAKFTPNATTVGNSQIFDNGTNVGIGTTSPTSKLQVDADISVNGLTIGKGASSSSENTAVGAYCLAFNTTGPFNTAVGYQALYYNKSGSSNTAVGDGALRGNVTGFGNVVMGVTAMYANSAGGSNTAIGYWSLQNNTSSNNTAVGFKSLFGNTTGTGNTAIGIQCMDANISGSYNTCLGNSTDVSTAALTFATAIGASATVNASQKIRFGSSAVTVIEGPVAYSFPSDGRFKYNITESDVKGLDFIKRLRPVEYNFDTRKFEDFLTKNLPDSIRARHFENIDFGASSAVRQSGFVAQDVEQAMKESDYNFNGVHKPVDENDNYSVAYSLFVVPLVKGMQEQQKMIEEQNKIIGELKMEIKELQKR